MPGINPKQTNAFLDLRLRLEALEAEPVSDANAALAKVLRADIKGIHALSSPLVWKVLDPLLERLDKIYPEKQQADS